MKYVIAACETPTSVRGCSGPGEITSDLICKSGKTSGENDVVSDDHHFCTEEAQRLVKVPGNGVKVVDHQHFDWACEMGWKRHRRVSSKRGIGVSSWWELSVGRTSRGMGGIKVERAP